MRPLTESAATQPRTDGDSLVGARVRKYDIVRVIGRGGMGMVYEGVNSTIGKRVAMKFVDAELAKNTESVARFQREAEAASAVESAHIVQIFDSGISEDGLPFIVMELLQGEDLGHRIERSGRLELAETLHIVAQILRGLRRAHEAGIVHRDLKPDNIFLVDRDDDPSFAKILDFGISKVQRSSGVPTSTLTRQGTVLGTPFYMSPEQAQALAEIDGRTDLWSVGAIMYECLTGRTPHPGGSYEQVIVSICMKDADDVRLHNPAVSAPIAMVIARALERDRDKRFSSAQEFLDALIVASEGQLVARVPRSGPAAGYASGAAGNVVISSTPSPAFAPARAEGFGPTLEVSAPDKSGSAAAHTPTLVAAPAPGSKRYLIAVAAAALLAGAAGMYLWLVDEAPPSAVAATDGVASAAPSAAASEAVEIALASDTPGVRFRVDGALLDGTTLRGTLGERRNVRAEAEGYQPVERIITLDPSEPKAEFTLDPVVAASVTPPVMPAATATAAAAPVTPRRAAPPAARAAAPTPPAQPPDTLELKIK